MPQGDFASLKGVYSITDTSFYDQIVSNLISFFDWGILNIGGFYNVSRAVGNRSILTLSADPNYPTGTVWQSTRGNWVWEVGLASSIQPTSITGIYVDNVFVPNDGSQYFVDYARGRIVFNSAQAASSVIQLDYSYKKYSFYDADTEWFRQVVIDPIEQAQLTEILAKHRVYLPAVILEYVPESKLVPYQIGTGVWRYQDQDILFHILSDSYEARNKIVDIVLKQFDKTIYFYNLDLVAAADAFPLNQDGSLRPNPTQYPDMVTNYYFTLAEFQKTRSDEIVRTANLYRATVRVTLRITVF